MKKNYSKKKYLLIVLLTILLNSLSYSQNTDAIDSSKVYEEPEVIRASLSMLIPPEGFIASNDFDGYINMNMGAAILMSVIDKIPYSILKASMTDEFFEEKQMIKISETPIVISESIRGITYKSQFSAEGHDFIRIIVYAGTLTKTLWLNITYPKIVDEQLEPAIMKSLQSINLSN